MYVLPLLIFMILTRTAYVTAVSSEPITIHSIDGKSLHQLYVKYQPINGQTIPQTDDFGYITGLNQAFHVTRNTLFRITFQGSIYNRGVAPISQSIQILVNDYLIIGNRTIPNTSARASYGLSGSVLEIDNKNGFYQVDTRGVGVLMPITRIAYVFLSEGVYSFNVGSRARTNDGSVYDGTVTYELIQSEDAREQALGEFQLVKALGK